LAPIGKPKTSPLNLENSRGGRAHGFSKNRRVGAEVELFGEEGRGSARNRGKCSV